MLSKVTVVIISQCMSTQYVLYLKLIQSCMSIILYWTWKKKFLPNNQFFFLIQCFSKAFAYKNRKNFQPWFFECTSLFPFLQESRLSRSKMPTV